MTTMNGKNGMIPVKNPRSRMLKSFIPRQIKYDGSQIKSLWAYKQFRIQGDSIVAFVGKCDIPFANMVDQEDVLAKSRIYSPLMLHFIVEHFDADLDKAILRQRLLAVIVRDVMEKNYRGCHLRREGDDLYATDGPAGPSAGRYCGQWAKLSVSIATASPISTKIHFGINIKSKGTPVLTRGLYDYDVRPVKPFALEVMSRYCSEMADIRKARTKVNWVK